jgi:hypothetical protein
MFLASGSQEDLSAFLTTSRWWNIVPHAVSVPHRNFDSLMLFPFQSMHEATEDVQVVMVSFERCCWPTKDGSIVRLRGPDSGRPTAGVDRRLDISHIEFFVFHIRVVLANEKANTVKPQDSEH